MKKMTPVGLLVFLAVLAPLQISAKGQDDLITQINSVFIDAAARANPAVVTIFSEREMKIPESHPFFRNFEFDQAPRQSALGSGVIIDAGKGYIITNDHVIDKADDIRVRLINHREVHAELVGTDPRTDVAVIRIDLEDLHAIHIGDSDELRVGEWVLAIGSPFNENLENTVTSGIVSGTGRNYVSPRRRNQPYEDYIQTDAAINPGNSGGALVNLRGELVGINAVIATNGLSRSSAGVGFAIPVNLVMRIVDDLIKHGTVTRAYLGVNIQNINAELAKALKMERLEGALVTMLMPDTPAEKAGIQASDVIVKVDDIDIRNGSHLSNLIASSHPGDKRKITLIRGGKKKVVSVTLAKLESSELLAGSRDDKGESTGMEERTGFVVADLDNRNTERFGATADDGVIIIQVDPRSNAARQGLRAGDVVVRVGDYPVENLRDYERALKKYAKGETVLLRIASGDSFRFVGIELS